jgi:uroporphyrinogen decarboxylase
LSPRELFLTVLNGTKTERLPVWFASHYGYWDAYLRSQLGSSTLQDTLTNTDAMIAQATESARRWQLDGVTAPTHVLAAAGLLGQSTHYSSDGTHVLNGHLHSPQQIRSLHVRMQTDVLTETSHRIEGTTERADQRAVIVPHMGPLTLAGHLIEGVAEWQPRLRALLFQYPTEARTLLTQAAGAITAYGRYIQPMGANALYIDEAWSSLLAPEDQSVFVLPYLERIVKSLAPFPVIVRAPGMDTHAAYLRKAGVSAWMPEMHTDALDLRNKTLHSLALLGPFDPGRLLSPIPVIKQAVGRLVELYGERDFIVSLASSPLPHTDPRHLHAFVEAAKHVSISS